MTNITVKQRPTYITSDGKEFTDQQEAIEWQAALDTTLDIAKFVAAHYPNAGQRHKKMLTGVILKWEQMKAIHSAVDSGDLEEIATAE